MKVTSNIHTHTTFSDGMNTPEEMVISAINAGFTHLGFSDHSYTDFDLSYCVPIENYDKMKAEISRLKEKYSDQITIFSGIEFDAYSKDNAKDGFDYFIGACHYVHGNDGIYYPVDCSIEATKAAVENGFDGDELAFWKNYYDMVLKVCEKKPVYIAHFDLPLKYKYLNEDNPQYKKLALSVLDAVLDMDIPVEINTGALARGSSDKIYPSKFLLERIRERNGKIIFGSDCHKACQLDFAFDEARRLAASLGFNCFVQYEGELVRKGVMP